MSGARIQLDSVQVKDVHDFALHARETHSPGDVTPVSAHRARAWARNPCAADDDVALIVARREGRVLGYLGLMPGLMRIDGANHPMSWFSTWFVPESERQTGAGAMLLMRAIGLRRDLAVTYFSPEAERVYRALRFKPLEPLRHLELNFMNRDPLSAPLRVLRKLVTRGGSAPPEALNRLVSQVNRPWKRVLFGRALRALAPLAASFEARRVERLSSREFETARDAREPVRFFRDADVVHWTLDEPWLVTDRAQATPDYYFQDYRPLLEYACFELRGARAEPRGFALLRLEERDSIRKVTVFDHWLSDPADHALLLPLALEQARRILADKVWLPAACADAVRAVPLLSRMSRESTRPCFCHPSRADSPMGGALDRFALDLADGDSPFA